MRTGRHGWAIRLTFAMLAMTPIACSSPTDLCGCSEPAPSRTVEGIVRDSAGVPLPGAVLSWRDISLPPEAAEGRAPVTVTSDGRYSLHVYAFTRPDQVDIEVRVWHAAHADTLVVPLEVAVGFGLTPLTRDFVLPP